MRKIFHGQNLEFIHESNLWANFYLIFNDENLNHCLNAYYNSGIDCMKVEEIKEENREWIRELRGRDITDDEILLHIPEAAPYLRAI